MDAEAKRLSALAEQMDPDKRRDLQEVLLNELQRRKELANSNGGAMSIGANGGARKSRRSAELDRDAMKDIYASIDRPVQELRVKQLEEQLMQVRGLEAQKREAKREKRAAEPWFANPFAGLLGLITSFAAGPRFLLLGLVACGILKIVFTATDSQSAVTVPSEVANPSTQIEQELVAADQNAKSTSVLTAETSWSEGDKALLTRLDERRVELERRSSQLDQREREIEDQSKVVAERVAELRSISNKLAEVRREKDTQQYKRLEQLASVYSSMAPNEAAELISRTEDDIALGLLERMPGKRLGQILGLMKPERAVELTKRLTSREKL